MWFITTPQLLNGLLIEGEVGEASEKFGDVDRRDDVRDAFRETHEKIEPGPTIQEEIEQMGPPFGGDLPKKARRDTSDLAAHVDDLLQFRCVVERDAEPLQRRTDGRVVGKRVPRGQGGKCGV